MPQANADPANVSKTRLSQTGGERPWQSAHAMSGETILQRLESDGAHGLSAEQVERRYREYGYNELAEAPPTPLWRKLASQFAELVIWILIVAAVISGFMGEWVEAIAIIAIVLLNGVLGFLQEERAERALAALQQLAAPLAKVYRGGVLVTAPARELVPGDRVEIEAGDHIPADARILQSFQLRTQESALTGESTPVTKDGREVLEPTTALGDRRNMVYMGTIAVAGKANAVVVATGMETQLGQIAGILQRQEPEPTPLQRRLAELGKILVVVCLVIVAVIFALNMLRGGQILEVFLVSVSLAVAAVPEGLPAVVTVALALGVQRMVKRHALIRKLPSVETLGSVTVICSDKTGTLTRNEMTVRVVMAGERVYHVSGVGYAPNGQFLKSREPDPVQAIRHVVQGSESTSAPTLATVDPAVDPDLPQALEIAIRCNNAKVRQSENASDGWIALGDPTEAALVVAAIKGGRRLETADSLVHENPFDSDRKLMSCVFQRTSGARFVYAKGAPEILLLRCAKERRDGQIVELSDQRRQQILQINHAMSEQSLRVLALGFRELTVEAGADESADYLERDLVFAGLAGMIDPPRLEVRAAIERCDQAGIRPVMITGDHPGTAWAIARELGMARDGDRLVTGVELDAMSDDRLADEVEHIAVYARVSAEHKLRVVNALKSRQQIVAMTGDGVNDAPAVKAADIGVAMGKTGTDVTKEASDMVLTDDNFASIVNAVEEGRGIFDNIQKFVHYLLSCNVGEVLFMFFATLVNWPIPLAPIQLLWINLVTDGLPALALGLDPIEHDVMRRRPRPPHEPVITAVRGLRMLRNGFLIAVASGIGFAVSYEPGNPDSESPARCVAFCIMAFSQLFFAFTVRSESFTLLRLGIFSNPHLIAAFAVSASLQFAVVNLAFLEPVFETQDPSAHDWVLILVLSILPAAVIELIKWIRGADNVPESKAPTRTK